jgi:hypothetical protein
MANSLSISISANGLMGGQSFPVQATANTVPVGDVAIKSVQSIATSPTLISLASITQCGYVVIVNMDSTNYVDISFENTGAVTPQTVLAGGFIVLSPASAATIYGKAHTSAVEVTVLGISI